MVAGGDWGEACDFWDEVRGEGAVVWGCECRGREGDEEGKEREGEGKREGVVHDDQMRVVEGIRREIMTKRVLGMFTQPIVNVDE